MLEKLKWDLVSVIANDFLAHILHRLPLPADKVELVKKHAQTFIALCATGGCQAGLGGAGTPGMGSPPLLGAGCLPSLPSEPFQVGQRSWGLVGESRATCQAMPCPWEGVQGWIPAFLGLSLSFWSHLTSGLLLQTWPCCSARSMLLHPCCTDPSPALPRENPAPKPHVHPP